MSKFTTLLLIFILMLSLKSCSSPKISKNSTITLQEWLAEKEVYDSLMAKTAHKDCQALQKTVSQFKVHPFKRAFYIDLAHCFYNNGKLTKAKKYLLKYIAAGVHISWIDSTAFPLIYQKVKANYPTLHHKFWKDRDTSYFQEVEKRVKLDQALVGQPKKRGEVINDNTKYLMAFVKKHGYFPWQPEGLDYFKKEKFRTGIDLGIIAIHAAVKDKIILRKYAIKSARKGVNSWRIPIGIGVTFYTQRSSKAVNPIRFIYFDSTNNLQLDKSYLQLYCLKRFIENNNIDQIKIQPSKANSLDTKALSYQLSQLKKYLVNEFSLTNTQIIISETPNSKEHVVDLQSKGAYNYTFTIIHK